MGMRMPSWVRSLHHLRAVCDSLSSVTTDSLVCLQYDITSLTKTENDENKGIEDSRDLITALIDKEVRP